MRFYATYVVKRLILICLLPTVYYIAQLKEESGPINEESVVLKDHVLMSSKGRLIPIRGYWPSLPAENGHVYNERSTQKTSNTTCAIRDIIKKLYGPNVSSVIINTVIEELRHCKTIYFTSVRKCATRTVFHLFRSLEINNTFKAVSWLQQKFPKPASVEFMRNLTNYPIRSIHRREARYLNFTKFGFPQPVYTSLIRHPVDKLVSLYYFRIFGSGDDTNPMKGMDSCLNVTLDEVMETIDYSDIAKFQKMLYYDKKIHYCWPAFALIQNSFCDKFCWHSRYEDRFEISWNTLVSDYLIVGISEELGLYVKCLETLMPRFFKGLYTNYEKNSSQLWSTFKTSFKWELKPKTLSKLEKLLERDIQFYERVRQRFHTLCSS